MYNTHMNKLVSVVLITYNSSAYIIEALDSVTRQTYDNIELIISDDCSNDNTVDLCKKWLRDNGDRFSRVVFLTCPYNTGISANCNRGFKAANGYWIKLLAGDDILLENCIKDNVDFILQNSSIRVLQSDTYVIDENSNVISNAAPIDNLFKLAPPCLQFKYFSIKYSCNTTTLFLERDLLQEIGWIDEDIKMMEDTQLYCRLMLYGVKLYFHEKATTAYRCNLSSVSYDNRSKDLFYPSIFSYTVQTYDKYVLPNLSGILFLSQKYRMMIIRFFMSNPAINKKTKFSKFLYRFLNIPYLLLSQISLLKIKTSIKRVINNPVNS